MSAMAVENPLEILQSILPDAAPFVLALAFTSLVIIVSNSFKGAKKIMFQAAMFAGGLAASISYLLSHSSGDLVIFWTAFKTLSPEVRFALAVILITTTFFGGAMYIAPVDKEDHQSHHFSLKTPASCDTSIGFDLPRDMSSDDKVFFESFLGKLCKEIISDLPTCYEMPDEAVDWIDRMLQYTVAGGKMNRGLAMMDVQKTLFKAQGKSLTPEDRCKSAALGWCIEFLQAFFLVADDVMDDSVTRRGQPCWFRRPEVKLISINDSFILESCVYKILKRYFGADACYPQLVDLFIEVTRQTELGQLLDLTSQPLGGPIDLSRFTLDRYSSIVKYKTAFYSFYLPVALGMIVSGIKDVKMYQKAREILMIMGEYFQIQDDYLDCYGSPEVIGKVGTDIQDNKCSWLVCKALEMATPKQRQVLEVNYGQHSPVNVLAVKKLYIDLNLEKVYLAYEEKSYGEIQKLLSEVNNMPKEVFEFLLAKIYKRSK